MSHVPELEACVETFEEALAAQSNGADRIELCARLDLDGITPPKSLVERCIAGLNIPVKVMIRAHGGDFRYSEAELEEMEGDVAQARKLGAFGVVFGFLNSDRSVDLSTTARFVKISRGLDITFHKAIDRTADPIESVAQLMTLRVPMNVLSSGGADTAIEGADVLKSMAAAGEDLIRIIPAGGITLDVVKVLHPMLNAETYHGRRIVPVS